MAPVNSPIPKEPVHEWCVADWPRTLRKAVCARAEGEARRALIERYGKIEPDPVLRAPRGRATIRTCRKHQNMSHIVERHYLQWCNRPAEFTNSAGSFLLDFCELFGWTLFWQLPDVKGQPRAAAGAPPASVAPVNAPVGHGEDDRNGIPLGLLGGGMGGRGPGAAMLGVMGGRGGAVGAPGARALGIPMPGGRILLPGMPGVPPGVGVGGLPMQLRGGRGYAMPMLRGAPLMGAGVAVPRHIPSVGIQAGALPSGAVGAGLPVGSLAAQGPPLVRGMLPMAAGALAGGVGLRSYVIPGRGDGEGDDEDGSADSDVDGSIHPSSSSASTASGDVTVPAPLAQLRQVDQRDVGGHAMDDDVDKMRAAAAAAEAARGVQLQVA